MKENMEVYIRYNTDLEDIDPFEDFDIFENIDPLEGMSFEENEDGFYEERLTYKDEEKTYDLERNVYASQLYEEKVYGVICRLEILKKHNALEKADEVISEVKNLFLKAKEKNLYDDLKVYFYNISKKDEDIDYKDIIDFVREFFNEVKNKIFAKYIKFFKTELAKNLFNIYYYEK